MLPNLYSFVGGEPYAKTFNSIPVPAPMATFARTENSSLYYRSLCEESRARLLNGEKIYGFSFDECSSNAFKLFEQAQDELIKMKKKYGL
ncbi:hypothetical protein KKH16_00940 [Patescibacteria group bacterium]|nr:hypothetical protein [Patescibacteria group bacterium]